MKKFAILMSLLLVFTFLASPANAIVTVDLYDELSGCTIGVNHASVTTHNSPVLWKVRDIGAKLWDAYPGICQSVQHYSDSSMQYDFIALVHWLEDWPDGVEDPIAIGMGLNEAGVGVGHADVNMEIPHFDNWKFQNHILWNFSTMGEIREFIAETIDNNPAGNFPFIDSAGNASMFELDPSEEGYWEYDTMDPDRESQGLLGFVVRANEFHKQDEGTDDTSIKGRYLTGTENTLGLINALEFNEQTVVQGDSNQEYRLIRKSDYPWSISNFSSRSAAAIQGAAPGEDPALATMWALLGQPSFSIAVPTWVAVSDIPEPIVTCAMSEAATSLYNTVKRESFPEVWLMEEWVQAATLPAEAHLFEMVNERLLPHWRTLGGAPDVDEMTRIEHQMAWDAYRVVNYLATTHELNLAPAVDFEAQQLAGSKYKFNPVAADADGSIASYEWNFGDGDISAKAAPVHEFLHAGDYLVSVTVTDDDGVSTTAWRYLTVE